MRYPFKVMKIRNLYNTFILTNIATQNRISTISQESPISLEPTINEPSGGYRSKIGI